MASPRCGRTCGTRWRVWARRWRFTAPCRHPTQASSFWSSPSPRRGQLSAPRTGHMRPLLTSPGLHKTNIYNVVLLLLSLTSGVRLAKVTVVFSSSFLSSQRSQSVVPTPIFCCCSPFSSHSFQISLIAVLLLYSRSSSSPFLLHQFLLKAVLDSNLHS